MSSSTPLVLKLCSPVCYPQAPPWKIDSRRDRRNTCRLPPHDGRRARAFWCPSLPYEGRIEQRETWPGQPAEELWIVFLTPPTAARTGKSVWGNSPDRWRFVRDVTWPSAAPTPSSALATP